MNILRWTWDVVTSLLGGILSTTDSPGTPACKVIDVGGTALRLNHSQYVIYLKLQLEAAADALRQIADLTGNNPAIDPTWRKTINKIASDGYEAASKQHFNQELKNEDRIDFTQDQEFQGLKNL